MDAINKLSIEDLEFLKESLLYTKEKFENYEYPNYEMKQKRLNDLLIVSKKINDILKELKLK